jgi:hypothetical protein
MSFRKSLLAATALAVSVAAVSASQSSDPPEDRLMSGFMKPGQPGIFVHGFPVAVTTSKPRTGSVHANAAPKYRDAIFDNIAWRYLDTNAAWISWYGYVGLDEQSCYFQSSNYHYCISETENSALAFKGTGKRATKIGVAGRGDFGIYSATASGLPGHELAGGSCAPSFYGLCWIDIDLFLKKDRKYFLEVSCTRPSCVSTWDMENTDFSGDELDYFQLKEHKTYNYGTGTHTTSFSPPWHETTLIPATGAAIIL